METLSTKEMNNSCTTVLTNQILQLQTKCYNGKQEDTKKQNARAESERGLIRVEEKSLPIRRNMFDSASFGLSKHPSK